MKYAIRLYRKGVLVLAKEAESKSHLGALKQVKGPLWTHAVVKGKTVKRYTRDLKMITDTPKFFKTTVDSAYAIMVMLGTLVEYHLYAYAKNRNEAFEEASKCMEFTPAGYVANDKEQKDIIASSEETSDSKSGSTSKKILSGSVMSAIWTDALTRTSIEKISGTVKSKSLAENIWLAGSKASHSKPSTRILWAKVKTLPKEGEDMYEYPGINDDMIAMEGKTIQVKLKGDYYVCDCGWMWKPEWLEFGKPAKVKKIRVDTLGSYGGHFVSSMLPLIGKTIHVTEKFSHGHKYYISPNDAPGWWFAPEWLDFEPDVDVLAFIQKSETLEEEIQEHLKFFHGAFPEIS
jgi:hypothetical protein